MMLIDRLELALFLALFAVPGYLGVWIYSSTDSELKSSPHLSDPQEGTEGEPLKSIWFYYSYKFLSSTFLSLASVLTIKANGWNTGSKLRSVFVNYNLLLILWTLLVLTES